MSTLEKQAHGGALIRPAKGEVMNPYGRPKKLMTEVIEELKNAGYDRVTSGMIIEVFEMLLGIDQERMKEIVNDPKRPMSVRIVAKAMLSPKGFDILEKVLNRVHGKPKQSHEITGPEGSPLLPTTQATEELIDNSKKIMEKLGVS